MDVSHLQPKRYLPKFLVFLDRLNILMSNIFLKKKQYYFDVFTSKKYIKKTIDTGILNKLGC